MITNEVVQNFDDDEYDDKFVESYYIKDEYQRKLFNLFHSDYMYFFWKRIQTIYDNILNDDKTKVSQIGQSKFLPIYGQDAGLHQLKVGEYSIQQGMLEMSNANTINEMLNTINISRGYESMAKILKSGNRESPPYLL